MHAAEARRALGRQLADRRRERQQTAAEVALRADLSVHTVRAAEQGRGGLAAFARVARALEAELLLVPAELPAQGPARQSNALQAELEQRLELPAAARGGIGDTGGQLDLESSPAAQAADPITLTDHQESPALEPDLDRED